MLRLKIIIEKCEHDSLHAGCKSTTKGKAHKRSAKKSLSDKELSDEECKPKGSAKKRSAKKPLSDKELSDEECKDCDDDLPAPRAKAPKRSAKKTLLNEEQSECEDVAAGLQKRRRGVPQSHPQHVIDGTVEWLRSFKEIDSSLQRYYKSVAAMWTSGQFEWTRGQAIPTNAQIYYWVRNSRRARPPLAKMSAKNRIDRTQKAMKQLATVLKARQFDYRGLNNAQIALSKSFERIVQLLHLNQDWKSVLMLAQISKSFNTRLARMELYSSVRRIVQGRNIDIDMQLVLRQMEYSELSPGPLLEPILAKQPSSIQLFVDFSGLPEAGQAHAINRFKGDFKDTIINMGDVLKAERIVFVGEGGFGSVFALPDKRVVFKVLKRPVSLQQAVKDVANEAASFYLGLTLNRIASGGMASRSKALPFAPLPATELCGSTSGAMALPSWSMGRLYYPAFVMQMAESTIDKESRGLSKRFFSDPMGTVLPEGFIRLASLLRLIAEPLAAMHSLNSAHRDLKEDNVLALRVLPGVQGYIHFNMMGKKWTGRLGDCGKALYFGVEFYTENEIPDSKGGATKRARAHLAASSGSVTHQPTLINEEMKPPADMIGKAGTVPLAIPMSFIHQHVPVAPSTQRKKDGAAAVDLKSKAPLYSGTLPYTPPEVMPKLVDGAKFLTARDYQPGDMWALGIMLANVLGGSGIRQSHLGSHDKKIFAQATDRVIWCKLNKLPAALQEQHVPSHWTDAMDLLRSLTREEPSERMTANEVLEHPFLKQADQIQRLYS
jgi:serine/threonine protein kinase